MRRASLWVRLRLSIGIEEQSSEMFVERRCRKAASPHMWLRVRYGVSDGRLAVSTMRGGGELDVRSPVKTSLLGKIRSQTALCLSLPHVVWRDKHSRSHFPARAMVASDSVDKAS